LLHIGFFTIGYNVSQLPEGRAIHHKC